MDTDTTSSVDSSLGREDICKISEETVLCKPHSNSLQLKDFHQLKILLWQLIKTDHPYTGIYD